MATDIRELDPNDPGYGDAIEAAVREECEATVDTALADANTEAGEADANTGDGDEPATTDEPGPTPVDGGQVAAPEGPEAPAAEDKPAKIAGVVGKDGIVLPPIVLKRAREEAKSERLARKAAEAEAAELRTKLDALQKKDGNTTDDMRERAEAGLLTDEEREDFPALAKIEAALQKLTHQPAASQEPAPKAEASTTEPTEDDVQDAIDSIPVLAGWQAEGSEKWKRAVAHDDVLRTSPKWKDRPLPERFAHVARLVAEEFDEEPAPPASSAPAKPAAAAQRNDPKTVVQELRRAPPNTLSDFKGGADPGRQEIDYYSMTDEEIEADLRKRYGG